MKRNLTTALTVIALISFAWLGIANITKTNHKVKLQDIQLKSKQSDLIQLENKFDVLNKELQQKNIDAEKTKELEQEKLDLQKQLDQAQKDLQAKARIKAEQQAKIAEAARVTPTAYAASGNYYKDYIYAHESGNCPTKWQGEYTCSAYHGTPSDPNVGYGLCQATPGWKMASAGSDWATNYDTQDRWCTQYANKYGGWAGAYAFWISAHWW